MRIFLSTSMPGLCKGHLGNVKLFSIPSWCLMFIPAPFSDLLIKCGPFKDSQGDLSQLPALQQQPALQEIKLCAVCSISHSQPMLTGSIQDGHLAGHQEAQTEQAQGCPVQILQERSFLCFLRKPNLWYSKPGFVLNLIFPIFGGCPVLKISIR